MVQLVVLAVLFVSAGVLAENTKVNVSPCEGIILTIIKVEFLGQRPLKRCFQEDTEL